MNNCELGYSEANIPNMNEIISLGLKSDSCEIKDESLKKLSILLEELFENMIDNLSLISKAERYEKCIELLNKIRHDRNMCRTPSIGGQDQYAGTPNCYRHIDGLYKEFGLEIYF